jgi:hypothetical protein
VQTAVEKSDSDMIVMGMALMLQSSKSVVIHPDQFGFRISGESQRLEVVCF